MVHCWKKWRASCHPALFLWFFFISLVATALVLQRHRGCLFLPIVGAVIFSPRVFFRAVYRVRWIFFVSFISLAWTVPGRTMGHFFWSPTAAGVDLFFDKSVYLLAILSWWVLWLSWLCAEEILSALISIFSYFSSVWPHYSVFSVRLALTLAYTRALITDSSWSLRKLLVYFQKLHGHHQHEDDNFLTQPIDVSLLHAPLSLKEKGAVLLWLLFWGSCWLLQN